MGKQEIQIRFRMPPRLFSTAISARRNAALKNRER